MCCPDLWGWFIADLLNHGWLMFSSQISCKYQVALSRNVNKRISNDCLYQNVRNEIFICAQVEQNLRHSFKSKWPKRSIKDITSGYSEKQKQVSRYQKVIIQPTFIMSKDNTQEVPQVFSYWLITFLNVWQKSILETNQSKLIVYEREVIKCLWGEVQKY